MKKKTKKILLGVLLFILLAGTAMVLMSPYGDHEGFNYKIVFHTVEINAPVESVFAYLGNSSNASRWSSFVNHITPLNKDSFPDGQIGSRRRCFCNADESGKQWDESVIEIIPEEKRQLAIYGFKEFLISADNLATEQIYESMGKNQTRLTFTLFFKDGRPSVYDSFKMYTAGFEIQSIFRKNLQNIKRILEEGH